MIGDWECAVLVSQMQSYGIVICLLPCRTNIESETKQRSRLFEAYIRISRKSNVCGNVVDVILVLVLIFRNSN